MAGNEYLIPIGADLGGFISSLRETRQVINDVDKTAKQTSQTIQQSFTNINEVQKKVTQSALEYNKTAKQQAQEVQKVGTVINDFAGDSVKLFSDFAKQGVDGTRKIISIISELEKKQLALKQASKNALNPQLALEYEKGLEKVNTELKVMYGELDKMQNAGNVLDEFATETENADKKSKSLKTQLRELKQELALMEDQGLDNTKRFEELSITAGQLEDQIGDTAARIRALASDTKYIDATIQAVTALTAGFGVAQGLVGLFGQENEELAKALQKVNSVMVILQGLQAIQNILQKQNILAILTTRTAKTAETVATVTHTGAVVADTVATEGATVATTAFSAALAANPIGIVLVALGALVAAISYFSDNAGDAEEQQKNLNDALAEANAIMVDLASAYSQVYKDLTADAEKAVALAQAQGKSEKEIAALRIEAAAAKRDEANNFLATLGFTEETVKYNEDLITYRQEQLRVLVQTRNEEGKLSEEQQKKIDNLKSEISAIQAITGPARDALNKINDANRESQQIQAEAARKGYLDSLKSATAAAEARVIIEREGTKKRLDAEIIAIRTAQREQLANANLTEGEKLKINANAQKQIKDAELAYNIQRLNNRKSILEGELAVVKKGSSDELNLKLTMIEVEKDIAIKSAKENYALIEKANKESLQKRLDAIKEFNQKAAEDGINKNISELNTQIAEMNANGVSDMSDKYIAAKKQLIIEQQNLDIIGIQNSVMNEELKQQKIKEIVAKSNNEIVQLDKAKQDKIREQDVAYWKGYLDLQASRAQRIMNDENYSLAKRKEALKNYTFYAKASLEAQIAFEKDKVKNDLEIIEKNKNNLSQLSETEKARYEQAVINVSQYNTKINELTKAQEDLNDAVTNAGESIKNQIPNNLSDKMKDWLKGLGLDNADAQRVVDSIGQIVSSYTAGLDQMIAAKQKQVDELTAQIEQEQALLDRELEAQENGYANNVAAEQTKIEALKAERQKEIDDMQALQKQKAAIKKAEIIADSVIQGQNLITSASNIFKAFSGIPFIGVPLAIAAIAAMFGAFAAAKVQAFKMADEAPQFDKGGGLELNGPDHSQGGMDVIEKKSGKVKANVRGGEYMYVFKHTGAKMFEPLFDAINENNTTRQVASLLQEVGGIHLIEDAPKVIMPVIHQQSQQDDDYKQALINRADVIEELKSIKEELKQFKDAWEQEPRVVDYGDYIEITIGNNYTKRIKKKKE